MDRYSIVGLMFNDSIEDINVIQSDSRKVGVNLFKEKSILCNGLGDFIQQLSNLGLAVTNIAIELCIIAILVTAGDTKISRSENSQDSWTREIDLYIPVNNTEIWNKNKNLIQIILNFLSGDKWRLIFRKIEYSYSSILPSVQKQIEVKYDCVSLFSGGLDSFIGAIDLLSQNKNPLLVSHYWEGITSVYQNSCYNALKENFPNAKFDQLRAYIGFRNNLILGAEPENTLRARSFLFFSLAILTATALGEDKKVIIPENGLISINVPLNILRSGALSTRTTHPFYMAKFQKLLDGLNLKIKLENPYRFKTKGEMASDCLDKNFLAKNFKNTISCSSPGKGRYLGDTYRHCGHCVPCIIRKASLAAAFPEDDTDYRIGVSCDRILDGSLAEGDNYKSFKFAIDELEEIDKKEDEFNYIIRIPGSLEDYNDDEIKKYVEVYKRGMQEVKNIIERIEVK